MAEFFCCAHHARPAGYIIIHVTVFILFVSRHTHLVEQPSIVTKGRGRSKHLLTPIGFAGKNSHSPSDTLKRHHTFNNVPCAWLWNLKLIQIVFKKLVPFSPRQATRLKAKSIAVWNTKAAQKDLKTNFYCYLFIPQFFEHKEKLDGCIKHLILLQNRQRETRPSIAFL